MSETPQLRLAVHMVGTNIQATLGEDTKVLVRVRTRWPLSAPESMSSVPLFYILMNNLRVSRILW